MPFSVKVVMVMFAACGGYFVNNLLAIPRFPGVDWVLARLVLWFGLIAIAAEEAFALTASRSEAAAQLATGDNITWLVVLWCIVTGLAVALIYDGWKLITGIQSAQQQGGSADTRYSAEELEKLKQRLIREVRFRVRERLDYAVGHKSLMKVPMEPVPDEVESVSRPVGDVPRGFFKLARRKVLELVGKDGAEPFEVNNVLAAFTHSHVERQLLILGEPGAGKTTALLTLADALLDQAAGTGQFPYIFELSAWEGEQDILPWLTAQLKFDYSIDEQVSKGWITGHQLIPLLDGLDELNMSVLPKCVEKINAFASLPDQQAVVCCRTEEYTEGRSKLKALKGALRLNPLSDVQIEQYLREINRRDIWRALKTQPELVTLLAQSVDDEQGDETAFLRVPLFLQMLVLVYGRESAITDKKALFVAYIERQLGKDGRSQARQGREEEGDGWACKYRGNEPSAIETKRYLIWLARKLQENNSSNNFLIEQMQPNWLSDKRLMVIHYWVVAILTSLYIFAFMLLSTVFVDGLKTGFINSLIFSMPIAFIRISGANSSHIEPVEKVQLSLWLEHKQTIGWRDFTLRISRFACYGFVSGFMVGCVATLNSFSMTMPVSNSFFDSLLVFVASRLIYIFIFSVLGVILGLLFGVFDGLLGPVIDSSKLTLTVRDKPNQGIFASFSNFIRFTFLSYALTATTLYFLLRTELDTSLAIATLFSTYFGFYKNGGLPVLQHIVLRIILACKKETPWDYARFLKYTTKRRLTQQIGGRFRFIHRELLDYFAEMES